MSKVMISQAIALVVTDHAIIPDEVTAGGDGVECLCGDWFAYTSRWAQHVANEIVDGVLGGDL